MTARFNYTSCLQTALDMSAAVNFFTHGRADWRHMKTCTVCSSALPPAVEPVSCCQVLRFSAIEGCRRVGDLLWLCMNIPYWLCLSFPFVKPSAWQVFCETHDFSAPLSAPMFSLSLYPSLSLGMKEPHFILYFSFWLSFSFCQAVRYKFSSESSDPQKGRCILGKIRKQIRQSAIGLARQGWKGVGSHIYGREEDDKESKEHVKNLYSMFASARSSRCCLIIKTPQILFRVMLLVCCLSLIFFL